MVRTIWVACAAAALAVGCGGEGAPSAGASAPALDPAARQAEWQAIESLAQALEAKRAELAELHRSAATDPALAARIDPLHRETDRMSDELGRKLVAYINADPPVAGTPLKPEQLAAVRRKSREDLLIAQEHVELGGEYDRAIALLQKAVALDPENAELAAALADAQAKRLMTAERFAGVKSGMSEAEVIAALGRPMGRNVKPYPERKITAWYYPKNDAGEAAGVFFDAKRVVYATDFDAVKRTGAESAAPAAAAPEAAPPPG
jgi:hypothetical protein